MKLTDFLGGLAGDYVLYFPALARVLGGVTPAILLMRLLFWQTRPVKISTGEGRLPTRNEIAMKEIYKTEEQLQHELGFGRAELRGARKKLCRQGLLHERYARLEHQLYFRVDLDALDRLGASLCSETKDENRPWGKKENENDEGRNPAVDNTQTTSTVVSAAARRREKVRRVRDSGIVTYYDSDVTEAERIENSTTADKLSGAVQTVRASGKEPVPGLVGKQIEVAARRESQNSGNAEVAARHAASHAERLRRYTTKTPKSSQNASQDR